MARCPHDIRVPYDPHSGAEMRNQYCRDMDKRILAQSAVNKKRFDMSHIPKVSPLLRYGGGDGNPFFNDLFLRPAIEGITKQLNQLQKQNSYLRKQLYWMQKKMGYNGHNKNGNRKNQNRK